MAQEKLRARPKADFGTVRQLGSGRWHARYFKAGAYHNAPQMFATKAQANGWLSTVQADITRGMWIDPTGGKEALAKYVAGWLDRKRKVGHYRPRTEELIVGLLDRIILPALGHKELSGIKMAAVRDWYATVSAERTPGQAAKAYRVLRTIMNEAAADGLIPSNPCVIKGAGTEHRPERPMPTMEMISEIVEQLGKRYAALVWAAALSGLREGELFALERRDVDLLHKTISVTKQAQNVGKERLVGPPKSAAGVRTVAIPSTLVSLLDTHLATYTGTSPTDLVFTSDTGIALHRGRWAHVWHKAACAAGHGQLHFHDMRHHAGTLWAQLGATPKESMYRLGQSTMRASIIYQHSTEQRQREIADRMDEVLKQRQQPA